MKAQRKLPKGKKRIARNIRLLPAQRDLIARAADREDISTTKYIVRASVARAIEDLGLQGKLPFSGEKTA